MRNILRNGAGILFVIAVFVFVATLAYQIVTMGGIQEAAQTGAYQGSLPPNWAIIFAAIAAALSSAAIPFFGACVIDRADQWLASSRGERRL